MQTKITVQKSQSRMPGNTEALSLTGQQGEAHELDRLAAPRIDEQEAHPVARDQTTGTENKVADGDIVQRLISLGLLITVCGASEADGGEHDRAIQSQTVEGDV